MLYVAKKTDYALMALAYLAERPGRVASAREIAESAQLPAGLLMNILKVLQHNKLVRSTRGPKGGYQIGVALDHVSLWELLGMLQINENGESIGDDCCHELTQYKVSRQPPLHKPVVALQYKLIRFLEGVKLSDLVQPGRRIDVPVELVSVNSNRSAETDPTTTTSRDVAVAAS